MHAWTSRAQRYMRPYNLKARFTDQETEVQPETAGLSRATALLTPGLLLILLFCTSSLKILKYGVFRASRLMSMWRCWEGHLPRKDRKLRAPYPRPHPVNFSHSPAPECITYLVNCVPELCKLND